MTELSQKQIIFSRYLSLLLSEFFEDLIQIGEVWRSEETCALYAKEGKGIIHSCHELRLAVDINLKGATGSISKDKKDYVAMANFWKELPQLYPDAIAVTTCWGGDFVSLCDFYHFSITHNGIR